MKLLKYLFNFLMDSLETVTFVGSLYMVIYLFLFYPSSVKGASMEETLHEKDRLIVSKVSYKLHSPERGDIVVIQSPKNPDIQFVKRIIALPGDSIEFRNGEVILNGKVVTESYIPAKTPVWTQGYSQEYAPVTIPNDFIFVMGDNREHSSDSREFGPVPLSSVKGKVIYRYFPPEDVGKLSTAF